MSARGKLLQEKITTVGLEKEMRRVFPNRNNFSEVNYAELVEEAKSLGLTTRGAVRKVLLRQKKRLMEIDRSPIDSMHVRIYAEEMEIGYELVRNLIRRQMWFGWEALFRLALELEFGSEYVTPREAGNAG